MPKIKFSIANINGCVNLIKFKKIIFFSTSLKDIKAFFNVYLLVYDMALYS